MVKVNNIDNTHGKDAVSGVRHERSEKSSATRSVHNKELKAHLEKDTVEVSGKSAEFGKLIDQIKQMPDVRHDRINELKQKIASGDYQPSADDIADALLKDE